MVLVVPVAAQAVAGVTTGAITLPSVKGDNPAIALISLLVKVFKSLFATSGDKSFRVPIIELELV